MTRVVSVFLPSWSIDRHRRMAGDAAPPPEVPLVLAAREGARRSVQAVNAAARAAGLRVGMQAAKAQALVPGLLVEDADLAADGRELDRLAVWLHQRVAPVVAPDPPDGIVIDTTGADQLHGGENDMLDAIIGRLALSGVEARAAIADTWGTAYGLARHVSPSPVVAPPGHGAEPMMVLPIEALRLPLRMTTDLRGLGFEKAGDLIAQPRAPLALRFGPELGRRIAHALGEAPEPIIAIRPPDLTEVRRAFAEPIGAAETIARYIGQLVGQMCERLEAKGLGARRLDLVCHRVDRGLQTVRVGLARPVCDPKALARLLREKIEDIEPGFGIEIMTLAATLAEPLVQQQTTSSLVDESVPDVGGLIDILANRVGARAVFRLAPVASDVPERSVRRIAALTEETGATWPGHWPRPARLLPRPEPVETMALLPDHPPAWFHWRGIRRRVRRADGPERVFGEWWKREAEMVAVRDYFRVEDEAGERYWLFRAGDGEDQATGSHRWFLHGVFG
ncbi:MAG: Y-family DNA polymerase [Bosea sp. (in: a-proteobacteria)]|uniref:Y-family DNA polymerase n=1 Tax=Bosea sp. (in: a-proteobacteria) TaxID=1871050 RepID=UPI003F7C98CD